MPLRSTLSMCLFLWRAEERCSNFPWRAPSRWFCWFDQEHMGSGNLGCGPGEKPDWQWWPVERLSWQQNQTKTEGKKKSTVDIETKTLSKRVHKAKTITPLCQSHQHSRGSPPGADSGGRGEVCETGGHKNGFSFIPFMKFFQKTKGRMRVKWQVLWTTRSYCTAQEMIVNVV